MRPSARVRMLPGGFAAGVADELRLLHMYAKAIGEEVIALAVLDEANAAALWKTSDDIQTLGQIAGTPVYGGTPSSRSGEGHTIPSLLMGHSGVPVPAYWERSGAHGRGYLTHQTRLHAAPEMVVIAELPHGVVWPDVAFPFMFDEVLYAHTRKAVEAKYPLLSEICRGWSAPLVRMFSKNSLWVCSRAERMDAESGGCSLLWRVSGDIGLVSDWVKQVDRISGKSDSVVGTIESWTVAPRGKGPDPLRWVCELGRPIPRRHAERAGVGWEQGKTTMHHVAPPYVGKAWNTAAAVSVVGADPRWVERTVCEATVTPRG